MPFSLLRILEERCCNHGLGCSNTAMVMESTSISTAKARGEGCCLCLHVGPQAGGTHQQSKLDCPPSRRNTWDGSEAHHGQNRANQGGHDCQLPKQKSLPVFFEVSATSHPSTPPLLQFMHSCMYCIYVKLCKYTIYTYIHIYIYF